MKCSRDSILRQNSNPEKEAFPPRLNRFLNKIRTDELTLEDITAEVKAVRDKRYNAKRQ